MLAFGRRLCNILSEELRGARSHYTNMQAALVQQTNLQERCILVDEFDRPIGEATKKHCHQIAKDGSLPLHRAFSVFLFNNKGDLLIQKRSSSKISFPDCYTNTCCSHPLAEIEGEREETDALGIKRAAQRRLMFELGIPLTDVRLQDFYYLTRIHYKAECDDIWGEHEIDYILFLKLNKITLDINPDEISEIRWVSKENIHSFVKSIDSPLSPWFKLILQNQLLLWWDNLDTLHNFQDHSTIHRLLET